MVEPLLHELEKARPDRQALLRQAFHFPQEAARVRQCSLALVFDEFQEIRTLTHYPNSQYVLALLRAEMQAQSGMLYLLAGSAVSVLKETLATHGRIYDFCRYVYDLSLQKAAGYGALKAVLQILATEEGLTASQIARKLRVTSGTASDYLRWLREVDLVTDREHAYYFRDPVLRFWVANTIRGVEVSLAAEPLDLVSLMARLDAQLQRVSEELGTAQESRIRELMRRFDGVAECPWLIRHQTNHEPKAFENASTRSLQVRSLMPRHGSAGFAWQDGCAPSHRRFAG